MALQKTFGQIKFLDRHVSFTENELDDRRVLLAITVEIEDGCVEHVEMREGDSAEAVATKFCRDHSLPDQFVAPLTEHIVNNIVSISTEDNDPTYYGKDEVLSGNNSWLEGPEMDATHSVSPQHDYTSDQENRSVRSCGCKQKIMSGAGPTQGLDESDSSAMQMKKKTFKARQRLSERLLAPTLTSLAKRPQAPEKDKHKDLERITQRPISEKAKAVYMRLYAEFLRQKQRIELEKARNVEMYQEKIERNRTYVSKKSWKIWRMRGRTAKQYRNYGELLYSEGLSKREQLKTLIVKKQQEDELKEMKELTLKPEISKRAKQIRRNEGQIWHRLQTPDKSRQDQLQDLRNEIWEAKFMECTFKPRVNQQRFSEKLLHDGKDSSTSRFDQLFLDAENRRRRQAEYMQWYPEGVTFRPHINRQRHSHGLDLDAGDHEQGTVFDRLLHYASKLMEKKQMWQQMASKPVDPTTGQELFTPVTGRKPVSDRNSNELPIGEFLYQLKTSMDRKKLCLARTELQNKRDQASCQYVSPKSQKLLDGIKERRLHQIFDYLDQDKDGYVELETADLNQLADDVVKDVVRIKKMGGGKVLNFQSFVDSMKTIQEQAHKPSTVHLVLKHKRHDSPVHLQFKMDRYSRNLAGRRRRFSSSCQWYKLILADRAKWQADIEAMRKERQSLEMRECTFRPEIQKKGAHLKVSRPGNDQMCHPPAVHRGSKIVEKKQGGMHGFIFQEDGMAAERLETVPTGVSHESHNHVESPNCVEDMSSMVLLESLKSLKQIVAQSVESTDGIHNHVDSPSHADGISPMVLLEQLKSLKQIVAQSVESTDEMLPPQTAQEQDLIQELYDEHLYQHRIEEEKAIRSTFSDLPDPEGQKEGLFMGLMGA